MEWKDMLFSKFLQFPIVFNNPLLNILWIILDNMNNSTNTWSGITRVNLSFVV